MQCDGCESWLHLNCIGLQPSDVCKDEDFICRECKQIRKPKVNYLQWYLVMRKNCSSYLAKNEPKKLVPRGFKKSPHSKLDVNEKFTFFKLPNLLKVRKNRKQIFQP